MDTESAKPRINGSMLPGSIGQYVCVVGKNLGVSQVSNSLNGRFSPCYWKDLWACLDTDLSRWNVRVSGDE